MVITNLSIRFVQIFDVRTSDLRLVWTAGNVDVTIFDGNEVFAWGEGRVAEFVALVNLATTEGTLGGTFDEHGQEAGSSSCSSHHKLVLYA